MIVLALPDRGFAQSGPSRNAADYYQRAFERLPEFTWEEEVLIHEFFDRRSMQPTPEVRELINRAKPALVLMRRGARLPHADFGVDVTRDGFDILLPHLATMRKLARWSSYEAEMHFRDGHVADAVQSINAVYGLVDHSAHDGLLLSSLVSIGIFALADEQVSGALDRGLISPMEAVDLLSGVERIRASGDPFGMHSAILGEASVFTEWLPALLDAEDGVEGNHDIFADLFGRPGLTDEQAMAFFAANKEMIRAEVAAAGDAAIEVADILTSDHSFEQKRLELEELEERVAAGDYGTVAQMVFPAYGRVLEIWERMLNQLEEREFILREIAEGRKDALELVNAAVWYRKAIAHVESLDEQDVAAMARIADFPAEFEPDVHTELLAKFEPAVSAIAQAGKARRCEFVGRHERDRGGWFLEPHHAPMRDLGRLLIADSVRLAQAGEHDDAARRIGMLYRMGRHLGQDSVLLSAMTGHAIAQSGVPHLQTLLEHQNVSAEASKEMIEAIAEISESDPFDLRAAIGYERMRVAEQILRRRDARSGRHQESLALLRELSDEDAVSVIVARSAGQLLTRPAPNGVELDRHRRVVTDDQPVANHGPSPTLVPLRDVLDFARLPALVERGSEVSRHLMEVDRVRDELSPASQPYLRLAERLHAASRLHGQLQQLIAERGRQTDPLDGNPVEPERRRPESRGADSPGG